MSLFADTRVCLARLPQKRAPHDPLHATLADPVPLGKVEEFRAGTTLLDQFLHCDLAQTVSRAPRRFSLRRSSDGW